MTQPCGLQLQCESCAKFGLYQHAKPSSWLSHDLVQPVLDVRDDEILHHFWLLGPPASISDFVLHVGLVDLVR